ncbi:3-oxoacyl-ACP reductase [Streptacidiphilus pinicola]|uniref:3-oxoacyl-ACP reductase n=1 Tax=Streptacidiphilus pinicola TaxID=2219663 RepID=A0A2X0K4G8_9ACTN|nr:SDR family oxidoreductase [Streptacidiphilus pinicola]RAG82180.1 3-oxoacyl-ACP reductase [Streptacidiphilus pinicola]
MNSADRKVAVITGAAHGIGAGLVTGYRRLGYGVVATACGIEAYQDSDMVTVEGDLADPDTAVRVVKAGLGRFGRIDALVNTVGTSTAKPFTEYTPAEQAAVTNVDLKGFFRITQLAVEQMLKQGSGHVVQITSGMVDQGSWGTASVPASVTRGGLQSATKALAIEYASKGIRSNAVTLGAMRNPVRPEVYNETLAAMHPLGCLGEIEDIVNAVLYLESAPFVTGAVLHVDGGHNAGH